MMACGIHRLLCVLVSAHLALSDNVLNIDPTGQLGRIFEGIGGISGGGATSKLLVNYPPDLQSQILDYLFKPNFGASLHILKVEIGGDIQSTDGSEPSHMHYSWEENYQRGYEWWLMTEAKKRNPDIKLYALPWGFPGWIGEGSQNPYVNPNKTSDYIVRWINAAKVYYNLTIDYVGIWNERGYSKDYIKTLRKTLDKWGFNKCLIIASDNGWDIVHDMKSDKELDAAVHAVGCHYPGTWASQEAYDSGRLLWASEDYSTYNDAVGAGCWSRILNQNYVNGLMTSTIAWDLIASYYEGLPYFRDGLMSAYQPWSGKYTVELPIWATAHTTQFVNIGWKYLGHKNGVGHLPRGGSYVSLMSPDQNDLTIIFETISHDHSYCIRPGLPWYSVDPQDVTITLKGQFANITQMNVWFSRYDFSKQNHSMFNKLEPLKFVNGSAKLHLDPDVMFTLTTMNTGVKGAYPDSPPAKPFPVPYSDDFESYSLYQEPYDLAPQSGSFEVLSEGNNKFIRQMVTQYPVLWCNVDQIKRPNALIGNVSWTDYLVEVDYRIPAVNGTTGAMVAARIDTGGCDMGDGHGLFFIVRQDGSFIVSTDIKTHNVIYRGNVTVQPGWHKLSIFVQGHTVLGAFDQKGLFNTTYSGNPNHGFAGIGTDSYGLADFDNFYIGTKEEGIAKMREYFKIHKPRPLLFVKTFHMN